MTTNAHTTESPSERRKRRALDRARRVGYLLDEAFEVPVLGYRIGLDPLIGLVPVAGDAVAALLSMYVVFEGARAGASFPLLFLMTLLVVVDFVVGSLPLVGDLFDAVWKANAWNARLLERHVAVDG
ncbi:DUF4112 domain-containing protein [Halorientalis marina]|uniref:DUF4112 domain-containing protein n=1 Tax=Halorientalis marina TaxID=2931976 RepID=UPI001FF2EE60|nr:DUF4112 domain-containing protein [Halorientalis marina]